VQALGELDQLIGVAEEAVDQDDLPLGSPSA